MCLSFSGGTFTLYTTIKPSMKKRRFKRPFSAYHHRDRLLKTLGFNSYSHYLKSRLWSRIRARVFRVKGSLCLCGRPADIVHHNSYHKCVLLGTGDYLNHLHPLCKRCHTQVEYSPQGHKRDMVEVCRVLKQLITNPPKSVVSLRGSTRRSCLFRV